ncbi:unnamed protein product [Clavelina lepadiformis]|uniref:Uncharacterized protein n=1 Tax=Clavelina lepadiformis TaxID=159417 RepID=A0ABP0GQK7_CLALP
MLGLSIFCFCSANTSFTTPILVSSSVTSQQTDNQASASHQLLTECLFIADLLKGRYHQLLRWNTSTCRLVHLKILIGGITAGREITSECSCDITGKVVISTILSKLLTSELATSFNWMGKGHKRGMHSSQLAKAVIDAAKNSGIKEAESICEVKKCEKR